MSQEQRPEAAGAGVRAAMKNSPSQFTTATNTAPAIDGREDLKDGTSAEQAERDRYFQVKVRLPVLPATPKPIKMGRRPERPDNRARGCVADVHS
eukprot:COSAG04_NODE_753_length_10568_cov_1.796733_4_plen_95_part_00